MNHELGRGARPPNAPITKTLAPEWTERRSKCLCCSTAGGWTGPVQRVVCLDAFVRPSTPLPTGREGIPCCTRRSWAWRTDGMEWHGGLPGFGRDIGPWMMARGRSAFLAALRSSQRLSYSQLLLFAGQTGPPISFPSWRSCRP